MPDDGSQLRKIMTSMTQSCACVCVTPSFRDGRQRPPTQLALNSFYSLLPFRFLLSYPWTVLLLRFSFTLRFLWIYIIFQKPPSPPFLKKLCFFFLSRDFFLFWLLSTTLLLRGFFHGSSPILLSIFLSFQSFEVSSIFFIAFYFRNIPCFSKLRLIATRFFRSRMQRGDRVTSSPFAHLFACHLAQRTLPKMYCSIVRPPLS